VGLCIVKLHPGRDGYINRAGKKLPKSQRNRLEAAKEDTRRRYEKEEEPCPSTARRHLKKLRRRCTNGRGNPEEWPIRQEGYEQETGDRDWTVAGSEGRSQGAAQEVFIEEEVASAVIV
jgi:hypothetical protein